MNWFLDYPYLRWHIIFVIVPSLIIWLWQGHYLKRYKRTFLIICLASLVWGFIFDLVASSVLKLWFFNDNFNVYLFGLPLEEYMFLLFVPQLMASIFLLIKKHFHG